MADPEQLLRELWDEQGVPKEEQDKKIKEIKEQAKQIRGEAEKEANHAN